MYSFLNFNLSLKSDFYRQLNIAIAEAEIEETKINKSVIAIKIADFFKIFFFHFSFLMILLYCFLLVRFVTILQIMVARGLLKCTSYYISVKIMHSDASF